MRIPVVVAWSALLALVPAIVAGQQTTAGVITGQVRDTTGAVLPGVTVEVASPALIERARTAVTDENGQYRVAELRPGAYSVTFTLEGFGKFVRDNIELTSGFTASVNAELRVGSIAETLTVSGASPVVDLQNVTEQSVLPHAVLDAIPTGRSYTAVGKLVPGIDATGNSGGNDVGGSTGRDATKLIVHGSASNDFKLMIDGMPQMTWIADGSPGPTPAQAVAEEINLQYSALPAEVETGGVLFNMVPKTGSNEYRAMFFGNVTNSSMASNNVSDAYIAKGFPAIGGNVDYVTDFNPSFGGPIQRDRFWFFATYRDFRPYKYSTLDYNASSGFVYVPNTSLPPALDAKPQYNFNTRLTLQATPRNRFSLGLEFSKVTQINYFVGSQGGATVYAPEASTDTPIVYRPVVQGGWTAPVNNRLLVDIGGQILRGRWWGDPHPQALAPGAFEISSNLYFRSAPALSSVGYTNIPFWHDYLRAAVSYTAGSHAIKVGGNLWHGGVTTIGDSQGFGPYYVRLLNGNPNSVVYRVDPLSVETRFLKGDIFAQDQWTFRRLTVNIGGRIDTQDSGYPAQSEAATAYFPARSYPAGTVVQWRDFSPRLGVAYNLFGNGKTAVKASVSRYVNWDATAVANAVNPAQTAGATLLRSWNDANHDFVPLGDPTNPAANGELGPSPNANWGSPVASTYDPAWTHGWGRRGYNWERSVSVQQELRSNVSLNVGYFYRVYGNMTVVDNTAVTSNDYSSFCVTSPADPRLPGGGGQPICGLYDINPALVSSVKNVTTLASNFGAVFQNYKGIDMSTNVRLPHTVLQGGLTSGRELYDFCGVVGQLPNLLISGSTKIPASQCRQEQPWLTQVKFLGSFQLPWMLSFAATYQNAYNTTSVAPNLLPGAPRMGIQGQVTFTNAQILPSLGRNLAAGASSTATVNVVQPGTMWGDRLQQIDLRVARTFKVRRTTIKPMADLYNSMNTNTITSLSYAYGTTGASWLNPLAILPARLFKIGVEVAY